MNQGDQVDAIEARRYEIWERLNDIFNVEPQPPGTGGKFRLGTIVVPTIDAHKQLWNNGFFEQNISYTAGSGARMISTVIPSAETWLVFNITWLRAGGDNLVSDLRLQGIEDSGGVAVSILVEPPVNVGNIFINFPGGMLCPGGTAFTSQLGGIGASTGSYDVSVYHQKIPESTLLPAPPFT